MLIAVLSCFLAACLAPLLHRLVRGTAGWVLAALPISLVVYFASHVPAVSGGRRYLAGYDWASELGVRLSFHLDGLGLLFALLITFVGTLVVVYAGSYLQGHKDLGRFYAALLAFMGAMLGLVLSDNLISLFVFWELTSLTSYFLIGFYHDRAASRAAALQALLVTGSGGLALLAGFLLLGQMGGTLEISDLLLHGRAEPIPTHFTRQALYLPALLLILFGAFTKSAQAPFHFWLPNAMEAPAPVSAYLHAATMVKAGVYLLARLSPLLGGTETWHLLVTAVGGVTMVVGAYVALKQTHLKRILAYSTVSSLGILVFLLGIGTETAVRAAMVYLLAHSLFKGALFLAAGIFDHETGEAEVTKLGGLGRAMPITSVAALLAAVSMAGLPPLFGFIAKESLLEAALHAPQWPLLLTVAAVIAAAFTVTAAALVSLKPCMGRRQLTPKKPHEAPLPMWLGPAALAGLGVVAGLIPSLVDQPLLQQAVGAILGQEREVHLHLWHGFGPEFMLSALAIAAGAAVYLGWDAWRERLQALDPTTRWGLPDLYQLLLKGLNDAARFQTALLQNGSLRWYLLLVVLTATVAAGYTLVSQERPALTLSVTDIQLHEFVLAAVTLAGAFFAVRAAGRLTAIASMGVAGYTIAVIFLVYGAPDLAMTQFVIETLTVILFVLAFYRLPRFESRTTHWVRVRDLVIASFTGLLVTMLVLVAIQVQFHPTISSFYGEKSVTEAHGRNVVNVILVDFRGLDTLGEITVLSIAGIGVFGLLRLRRKRGEAK